MPARRVVPADQIKMSEKPDEWRKRAIFWLLVRLLLGLIQIIGATTATWLLVTAGAGWLCFRALVITLFFALLHRLLFSNRPARRAAKRRPTTTDQVNPKPSFAKIYHGEKPEKRYQPAEDR